MLHLGLTVYIFALRTLVINANGFLQPWTAGPTKDYSTNQNFSVGVNIITEWTADFSNATINLNQDNKPGDAQGGPSIALEVAYNKTVWSWTVNYDGFDPAYNHVFYFSVERANGNDSFTGHYFNISNAVATTGKTTSSSAIPASSSTTSLSTASPTAPATSASTTSQSASPATVTAAASNPTGTPVGTIAGIVVGIVAGFLLLAGAAWQAWRFKNRRYAASMAQPLNVDSNQPYFDRLQDDYDGAVKHQVHEMDERVEIQAELHESGGRPIHELHHSAGLASD